jgi:hypothetical protein
MVCKNCSRRLARAYFSKLGWQANVSWRIAISLYAPFDASAVRMDDLIRGSLGNVHFDISIWCDDFGINEGLKVIASYEHIRSQSPQLIHTFLMSNCDDALSPRIASDKSMAFTGQPKMHASQRG